MGQGMPMQDGMQGMPPAGAPQQGMQGGDIDPDEKTFEEFLAGVLEHIYGPGYEDISKQLRAGKDDDSLAKIIGTVSYTLVAEGSKQAEQAQVDLDIDILLGVVTEIIDSLLKLAQKLKIKVKAESSVRERALIYTLHTYLTTANPSPEEQQIAQEALREMGSNGMVSEGVAQLHDLGEREGVDPFDQADAGQPKPKQPPSLMGAPR